jgi:hypothetical protein
MKEPPRYPLAHLPTPLEPMERLSVALGGPRDYERPGLPRSQRFSGGRVAKEWRNVCGVRCELAERVATLEAECGRSSCLGGALASANTVAPVDSWSLQSEVKEPCNSHFRLSHQYEGYCWQ